MAQNRHITDLPKEIFDAMLKNGFTQKETDTMIRALSQSSKVMHGLFFNELQKKIKYKHFSNELNNLFIRALLAAVVDENEIVLTNLLEIKPDLIVMNPKMDRMIESKLTQQKFIPTKAILLAAKRRQADLYTLLFSLLEKFEQTDEVKKAQEEALNAWQIYEMKKNKNSEDEMIIPDEYLNYAKYLFDAIKLDACKDNSLNEKTTAVIDELAKKLRPENGIDMANYLDVELLLLALYKTYDEFYYSLSNIQRRFFCVKIIGLVQSVLAPETARIFCISVNQVLQALKANQPLDLTDNNLNYRLKNGLPFYPSNPQNQTGLGRDYMCGMDGESIGNALPLHLPKNSLLHLFEKFLVIKNSNAINFISENSSKNNANRSINP